MQMLFHLETISVFTLALSISVGMDLTFNSTNSTADETEYIYFIKDGFQSTPFLKKSLKSFKPVINYVF